MHSHFALVSSFIFASTLLAHSVEHSQLFARAEQVTYENFRAGVVLSGANNTFRFITSSFVTPPLAGDTGSGINVFAAIDGGNCNNSGLRAGVKGQIAEDGSQVYTPYYQLPDGTQTFDNLTASAGDTITLAIGAMGSGFGSVTIVNINKNQTISHEFTSSAVPCRGDAMWAVQPPYGEVDGFFYPLANFIRIAFQDAWVIGDTDGSDFIFPSHGPYTPNIVQNNQAMTSVSVEGANITVTYL